MSKVRLILLSMLVVFVASAVASASAAAANGCEELGGEKCLWTLNGSKLPAGEMREVKVVAAATFTLKGTVGGAAVTLTANEVELKGTKILGGNPGTAYGRGVIKNVTVVTPKECKVTNKEVETSALKGELVELVKEGKPQKVDDALFEPEETGANFATVTFENNPKCAINGIKASLEGNVQAEPSPRKTEGKVGKVKVQGKEKWEFRRHGEAAANKSELKTGGKPVTLEGTGELELTDGLNWGTD